MWNGGIGLSGNFPSHHIVHHHGPYHHGLHHHHHHLHHFGDSKLVELSPSTTKYNFLYGGNGLRNGSKNSPEKLDLDLDEMKMSPGGGGGKVRFASKYSSSPTHVKYGKSPLTSSASLYQISVNGTRRPINQVTIVSSKKTVLNSYLLCSF